MLDFKVAFWGGWGEGVRVKKMFETMKNWGRRYKIQGDNTRYKIGKKYCLLEF